MRAYGLARRRQQLSVCNRSRLAINGSGHALCDKVIHLYWRRFTAAIVLTDQWRRHFGVPFVVGFGVIYSVVIIGVGRWLFGGKTL